MLQRPDTWSERFQDAALDPRLWPSTLQDMAEATGASRGQLIGVGGANAIPFNWVNDFPDRALAEFVRLGGGSAAINFRIAADGEASSSSIRYEADYAKVRGRLSNDSYLDFCRDNDIPFGCHTALVADGDAMVGLATLRSEADGMTTTEQRAEFAKVAIAARAAVRLQRAIEQQGVALVSGTLEAMATDCVLIDGFGRVGAMTPGAERAISARGDPRVVDGLLTSSVPERARRIGLALGRILKGESTARVALGPGVRLDLFGLAHRDWAMSFAPRAIAVIRDLRTEMALEATIAGRALGLSPAETDIATLLACGLSRAAICEQRRVSAATLKSQLKAIYQKTGVGREAELVSLMMGLR